LLSVLYDPDLETFVARLHERSERQSAETKACYAARTQDGESATLDDDLKKRFMSDKMVALEPDKAQFCYQLCRALGARRVVEVGTSFGVSTIYLAAALRENARSSGGDHLVIGTEHEAAKARSARANFKAVGLDGFIELREGDLRETLRDVGGPVDFVLIDIWTRMARAALELVTPFLRRGAVVVCDNTESLRAEYADYFAFIASAANRPSTMTLPFHGGLEMTVFP